MIMGEALKKAGWPRDSYIVSSHIFTGPRWEIQANAGVTTHKHIYEACHQAIKRLQVDYLDLYYCHRPEEVRSRNCSRHDRSNTSGRRSLLGHVGVVGAEIMEHTASRDSTT